MKKKYYISILIVVLLVSNSAFAQNKNVSDSLLNLLQKEQDDTLKVRLYTQLSSFFLRSNRDSSKIFADRGLFLAKKIEYDLGIGDMYIALGHLEIVQNNMFQAFDYYLKASNSYKRSNLDGRLPTAFLMLGNVSFTIGNYPDALDYYQRGLVTAEEMQLIQILPDFYNNLGELSIKLEDYDAATEYYNKGLQIKNDANDDLGTALFLVNLGSLNAELQDYDKAMEYLHKAHLLYGKISHSEGLYNVYNSYASIEQEKGNYAKAIEYYKEGHNYLLKIGSEYLGPMSILNAEYHGDIGLCYLKNKNFYLSEIDLLKAFEIADQTGQIEYLKMSSKNLSELYEITNKPIEALKYTKLYKIYSDSISREENIKKLTQLEMQFEFDKQMKQNEAEKAQLELRQKRKELIYIMISSGILLALIILFLLFRLQKYKVKKISLERENLLVDLEYKNKELTTNVMYLLKKNEFIINISDKLKKSRYHFKPENRKVIDDIIREIEHSSAENVWKDFEMRFQEVHDEFYQKLNKQFPDLSPNELKLCAFLRLNMSTKEISTITFQSPKSISMARFRLRKKMGIGSYDNLISFLGKL